jgi:transposase
MSEFRWSRNREAAALSLANGDTIKEAADKANVAERTVYRWKDSPDFEAEVDRLTLQTGISKRAERLRIAMAVVKARTQTQYPQTRADLLEWLKFAQSETDGAKHRIEDWQSDIVEMLKDGSLSPDDVRAAYPDLAAQFFFKAGVDAISDD